MTIMSWARYERAYIVPDDTIFNALLGNSLGLLHSLMPIILSPWHQIAQLRSSDHIFHRRPIHFWHRCWWGSMQLNY